MRKICGEYGFRPRDGGQRGLCGEFSDGGFGMHAFYVYEVSERE